MFRPCLIGALVASAFAASTAPAAVDLIAIGSLTTATDLSRLTGLLENGAVTGNALGGNGSGLAWAGGSTFLALPDRGPNAAAWIASVDNTTSYIARFHTVDLALVKTASGGLPAAPFRPSAPGATTSVRVRATALRHHPPHAVHRQRQRLRGRRRPP